MRIFGAETQSLEHQRHVTGVQRVVQVLHEELAEELAMRGARLVPIHTWAERERPSRPWADFLESASFMRRELSAPQLVDACLFLDISHVNFPRLFSPVMAGIPKVFFIHDVLPVTHPEWFPEGASRGYRMFVQQVMAIADVIVCSTQKVAEDLKGLGWSTRARIQIIPLGSFRTQKVHQQPSREALALLYVSTIEPRKGHDLLIDTFDLLRLQGHDVSLTLIGRRGWDVQRGWAVEQTMDRITQHKEFGGRLRWLNGADDDVVESVASRCTHAVIPAVDEGFGLFVEEGLSLGLKVVASDIPVFAERSRVNMWLAGRTPEEFAASILLAHQTEWIEMGPSSLRSMRDCAVDLAELLESLA